MYNSKLHVTKITCICVLCTKQSSHAVYMYVCIYHHFLPLLLFLIITTQGAPVGGHINNYLLEKSRVISQQKEERNFHIFYQLLQADSNILDQLVLSSNAENYHYLSRVSGPAHYVSP